MTALPHELFAARCEGQAEGYATAVKLIRIMLLSPNARRTKTQVAKLVESLEDLAAKATEHAGTSKDFTV
jgi:hypothetical protein